jgi:uncharacterized protein (DUF1800 family)
VANTDNALVAHLFRRAGFGLRGEDRKRFPVEDYSALVDALVSPKVGARDDQSSVLLDAVGNTLPVPEALRDAQANWMRSMVETRAPLVERMTLFLSNHFATAYTTPYVDATALVHQQATIRRHALGSFAELTHAMIDDVALAWYLSNDRNQKGHPNENLARELMELFLLGTGNYSEQDVKEVARALTGYELLKPPVGRPTLVYRDELHDDGFKTVLGVTAKFTPHGVVDLLLAQPTAKRFIATKLVTTFVSASPDPTLVGSVAQALHDWDLPSALRTIFQSSHFRAEAVRLALPKTPAEYVVGIMRGLGRTEYGDAVTHMSLAGHTLFRPPSVAGWPMGARMLGPGSMLARYNAASYFAGLHVKHPSPGLRHGADASAWMNEFGITTLSPTTTDAIVTYRRETARQTTASRTAGVLTLLLSSPEFQLA